jgi:adenine-specific DNA methylase
MTRSLIEQWFPAATIGAESLRDGSAAKKPPNSRLHVWWARRPLTAARATVVASLLPAWPSDEEVARDPMARRIREALEKEFPAGEHAADGYHGWFVRALGILGDPVKARKLIKDANEKGIKLEGNGYGYDRAFTVSPDDETLRRLQRLAALRSGRSATPVLFDPFAGGGSIPFEGARYGCDTVALELNPVAVAVLNGTVVLPGQLGPSFAKTIEQWGQRWAKRVHDRLAPYFPRDPRDESIVAYIWAHTVPCPKTGYPTPLSPNYWLATGKSGRSIAVALEPDHTTGRIRTSIVEGWNVAEHGDRSTYSGGTATSVWDPTVTISSDEIKRHAVEGRLGETLLAVSVTRPGVRGRQFRAPSAEDFEAVESAGKALAEHLPSWEIEGLVPTEAVYSGWKTDEPLRMGLACWCDMFAPRQLLTNLTLLDELHAVLGEARTELDDDTWRALGLYLGLALDKSVDYNGRLASWHSSRLTVRNTFDRHDFAFKWSFAEFDGAASLLPWGLDQVADAYKGIAKLTHRSTSLTEGERAARAKVLLGSATDLELPDDSVDVIVTDPPYYDNVMYGECSDYFYVWLKRSLRDTWPELTRQVLSDKEHEAVANPSLFRDVATHSGRGKRAAGTVTAVELADQRYEDLLTEAFREAHRVLRDDGVLTVMFTHKRVDAWDTLGAALLEAGFEIASSWPVHTESEHSLHQAKKNSASSTIMLGCRKRASTEPAYWTDIRREVEEVAEEAARRFADQGMRGVDLTLATYGPALSVLSRNWPVYTGSLAPDGQPEVIRPDVALDLARHRVAALKKRELLGGRELDFDRATDWWLLAWNDFQAAQFPSGEALKLCLAVDLDLDEVAKGHKLVKTASGNVTLLTPPQRRTARALDPDTGVWPTMVDALHALMLTFDEEGLAAARRWLQHTGKGDDERFTALFEAALHAVPRARDKNGAFTRPEARILESMRSSLFDGVAAPVDEPLAEAQATLF